MVSAHDTPTPSLRNHSSKLRDALELDTRGCALSILASLQRHIHRLHLSTEAKKKVMKQFQFVCVAICILPISTTS